jgi:hypothetical protein
MASRVATPPPPTSRQAGATAAAKVAPPSAANAAAAAATTTPPPATITSVFQGFWCAFFWWEALLLFLDCFLDMTRPKLLWTPLLLFLSVIASLFFVLTVTDEDLNYLPVVSKLTPAVKSTQEALVARASPLGSFWFQTAASACFCVISYTRIRYTFTHILWASVMMLSGLAHVVHILLRLYTLATEQGPLPQEGEKKKQS